jgi:hypothetical protein
MKSRHAAALWVSRICAVALLAILWASHLRSWDENLMSWFLICFTGFFGILRIVGTYHRWDWFDDPFLTKHFGRGGAPNVNYGSGVVLIAISAWALAVRHLSR